MYRELARWWPLFSPPAHYVGEAADLLPRLQSAPDAAPRTLLELGSGGGSLAFHLKGHLQLTLTDLSPAMLAENRAVNPECEHFQGDMRSIDLAREFDVVLIHDAIMYATTPPDVQATYEVVYAIVLREADGTTSVEFDRHVEGLFRLEQWMNWLGTAGFEARWDMDPWNRHIFVGRRPHSGR